MAMNVAQLRKLAFKKSIRKYKSLPKAISNINFVQYDPIRKPLRAQDLILFQRVDGYKPNDLMDCYSKSELEEDYLHVYGVLSKPFVALLHPRPDRKKACSIYRSSGLAASVQDLVYERGEMLARDVSSVLGRKAVTNDWGGKSSATTRALEELHYHGLLRVAKRVNYQKVYAPSSPIKHSYSPKERLNRLTLLMVNILSPVCESGIRRAIGQLYSASGGLEGRNEVIEQLLKSGEIKYHDVNNIRYYLPAKTSVSELDNVSNRVRFLSPFDPIVWDRDRFAHLWKWNYRFEAYTPKHLRRFGYYALPMFWRDQAVGWVNISTDKMGKLDIERAFATTRRHGNQFEREYEREVSRFESII